MHKIHFHVDFKQTGHGGGSVTVSDVGHINQVDLLQARLVLGWVTVQLPMWEIYLGLIKGQLSLAIPPWVGAISTGQRTVMLCGWEVKAGMAHVWWQ